MKVDFYPGDLFDLYLTTSEPDAVDWGVWIFRPNCEPMSATRVEIGEWLSPYRQVEAGDLVWNVGVRVFEASGTSIRIVRPDGTQVDLPHPGASDVGVARSRSHESPK